jgi:hypothetical protein
MKQNSPTFGCGLFLVHTISLMTVWHLSACLATDDSKCLKCTNLSSTLHFAWPLFPQQMELAPVTSTSSHPGVFDGLATELSSKPEPTFACEQREKHPSGCVTSCVARAATGSASFPVIELMSGKLTSLVKIATC